MKQWIKIAKREQKEKKQWLMAVPLYLGLKEAHGAFKKLKVAMRIEQLPFQTVRVWHSQQEEQVCFEDFIHIMLSLKKQPSISVDTGDVITKIVYEQILALSNLLSLTLPTGIRQQLKCSCQVQKELEKTLRETMGIKKHRTRSIDMAEQIMRQAEDRAIELSVAVNVLQLIASIVQNEQIEGLLNQRLTQEIEDYLKKLGTLEQLSERICKLASREKNRKLGKNGADELARLRRKYEKEVMLRTGELYEQTKAELRKQWMEPVSEEDRLQVNAVLVEWAEELDHKIEHDNGIRRNRTPRKDAEFVRMNFPLLDSINEAEVARKREYKEMLRGIKKELVDLGVPPEFFAPKLKEMEKITDPEEVVREIFNAFERSKKVVSISAKTIGVISGKKVFGRNTAPAQETKPDPNTSAIRIIDTMILAQFQGSINNMGIEQRQLIERNISEIRRFVLEYLLYLESKVGERGVFVERGINGSTFKEKFKLNTRNEGWRHFSLQDGDSRIVISIRPENREIMLTTIEVNHDRYVEQLSEFDARRVRGVVQITS